MSDLKQELINNRPNLNLNSLKTYISILWNLSKRINAEINNVDDVINNIDVINKHVENINWKTRKTIYSALIALWDVKKKNLKQYKLYNGLKKHMINDINTYNEENEKNEKNEKQSENWFSWEEIINMYHTFYNDNIKQFENKDKYNRHEFNLYTLYTLLWCLILIPPLRSLNYSELKIKDVNKDKDNYIDFDNNEFVFNRYKLWERKGRDNIKFGDDLKHV